MTDVSGRVAVMVNLLIQYSNKPLTPYGGMELMSNSSTRRASGSIWPRWICLQSV